MHFSSRILAILGVLCVLPIQGAFAGDPKDIDKDKDQDDHGNTISLKLPSPDFHIPGPNGEDSLQAAVENLDKVAQGYRPTGGKITDLKPVTAVNGAQEIAYNAKVSGAGGLVTVNFHVQADLASVSKDHCPDGSPGLTFAADLSKSGQPAAGWVNSITMGFCAHKNADGSVDIHATSFMTKGDTFDKAGVKKGHIKDFVKAQAAEFWKSFESVWSPLGDAVGLTQTVAAATSPAGNGLVPAQSSSMSKVVQSAQTSSSKQVFNQSQAGGADK